MSQNDKDLYVGIKYLYQRMGVGFQFFHDVEVIEYLDKPLFGPHEKVTTYEIGYCIKEVLSEKPFTAIITVINVRRWSAYHDLDKNVTFHTQRGHQFYPNGMLAINLPKVGDEFKVIDKSEGQAYDLCKGYIYSLHRYEESIDN